MSDHKFEQVIATEDDLREILGTPSKRAADKGIDHIDEHCAALIGSSPFLVIASTETWTYRRRAIRLDS